MARKSKFKTKSLNTLGLVGLILSAGMMGFLLNFSIVTSGFVGAVSRLRPAQFLSLTVIGATVFGLLVFLCGLALTFLAHESANDLWNRICAKQNLTKQDFYALLVGCGSIGFIFDKAILRSGVIAATIRLSNAEFCSPKIFPQVILIALMTITGVVMTFIASKSASQLWKIYSPTGLTR